MKLNFVQKRMLDEKPIIMILIGMIISTVTIFLILILSNYTGYLFGLKELNTNEKVNKFYNSKYTTSNLHFNNVIDTKEKISIETTRQTDIVGTMGAISMSPTKSTREYNVYFLISDDYSVIFCSEQDDIDFSQNRIKVINNYKKDNVNQDILNYFGAEDNTYVFYYSGVEHKTAITIMLGILVVSIITLCMIIYSKIVQKNSKLGKQINKLGYYEKIVQEVNEQAKNPLYKSGNVVICESYILLLNQNATDIMPIKDIQNLISAPDENYPDEIIRIEIKYNEKDYSFDVYSKEIEDKIINHVKNRI